MYRRATRGRAYALALGTALGLAGLATAQAGNDSAALWEGATLYRDAYGTPHIQAETVRGMAFAFGYAQAEDHLEPMLMAYRMALGRASAAGGESFARDDAFALKIANAEVASDAMQTADPLTRDLCEGFARGINAWILENRDRAPAWAEGVQPKDVLAWWHYLMVVSAPFDLPGVYHPEPPLKRANAWALAPGNTVEGAAILAMAPHQHYNGPYRWYEAHLMIGDLNWAGATIFGLPVLMMGHNEHLGWALTPNGADTADFFREELGRPAPSAADPRVEAAIDDVAPLLSFMASAKPFYIRTGNGLVERAVPSWVGARGPLFEGADGALYSWRNGAFGQFGGLRQLLLMARASNLAEFQQALALHQLSNVQVLYAGKAGDLFYAYNARLGNKSAATGPQDAQPLDWAQPVEAMRHQWAWDEIIPIGQLPHFENPESGYVQAGGTPPWLATPNSGLNPEDWPIWLVPEHPSYRVFRVNQILSAGRYSFPDMQAMLFDTLVPAAVDMVPLLLAMAEQRPGLVRNAHPDLVTALQLLREWDMQAGPDSTAMAYYSIWWTLMRKRHADEFDHEAGLYQALLANSRAAQEYALDAAVEAARIMRNDFGSLAQPWGKVHRIQRGDRNEPMFGTGTGDPIFLADNATFVNRQWRTNFGYGFAMAVQFSERTRAASVVPFGASDNPESPHYDDQMDLFLERRMKPTRFQHDAVVRYATSGYGRRVTLGTPALEGACTISVERPQRIELEEIGEPPGPFPGGQTPFTPAIRPVFSGDAPDHTWELELYVPEALCRPEHRQRLRIYTYTQADGWNPILGQEFNQTHGAFTARGEGVKMIAILGPRAVRIEPPPVPSTEILADVPPPDDFLREPIQPDSPPAADAADAAEAPDSPEAPDTAAPAPGAPPRNPLFDVEILGQQGPDGSAGPDAAPDEEKKGGLLAPLRRFMKSGQEKGFGE